MDAAVSEIYAIIAFSPPSHRILRMPVRDCYSLDIFSILHRIRMRSRVSLNLTWTIWLLSFPATQVFESSADNVVLAADKKGSVENF